MIGDDRHRLVHVQLCHGGGGIIAVTLAVGAVLGSVFHRVLEEWNPAHVQRSQMIGFAVNPVQGGVFTQVQGSQLIAAAVKRLQGGVFAQVQGLQLIVVAVKRLQGGVFAQVQGRQSIVVAFKSRQGCEVLDALQIHNVHSAAYHRFGRRQLRLAQRAVAVGVELGRNVDAEEGVREIRCVDSHVPRGGFHGGDGLGGKGRGEQAAGQGQGQQQGKQFFQVLHGNSSLFDMLTGRGGGSCGKHDP